MAGSVLGTGQNVIFVLVEFIVLGEVAQLWVSFFGLLTVCLNTKAYFPQLLYLPNPVALTFVR